MDIVYIYGLQLQATIGVHLWEKKIKQVLLVDLEMPTDVARAASTDSLDCAIDYASVSDYLMTMVSNEEYNLIETLAERMAAALMEQFSLTWIKVKLAKPNAVALAREVGVVIERGVRS